MSVLIQDLTPVELNWNWKNTQLLLTHYWISHQTAILPLKRNSHTTNYEYNYSNFKKLLDHLLPFIMYGFAVVLLPWPSALSPRSCIDDGRVGALGQASPAHPKDSHWGEGLDTHSQFEPDGSRRCPFGICPCHQKKKTLLEYAGHSLSSVSQLTSFFGHILTCTWATAATPDQSMPPPLWPVGNQHDGCITSSASPLTLTCPTLWTRVNLDSTWPSFIALWSNLYAAEQP